MKVRSEKTKGPFFEAGRFEKFKPKVIKLTIYSIITGLAIIYLVPFVWLLSTSLKTSPQIFALPIQWIPNPIAWENYSIMTKMVPFFRYLRNTCIIVIFNLGAALLINPLIAYGFAHFKWPGRDIIFVITLGLMMLPFVVRMVPLYVFFQRLGWINTFAPLIVPVWCGQAFLIFLLRQFFLTMPPELSDAARIDGASEFGIFWKIIYPLSKPALICVAIFQVTYDWNDFIAPLVYLNIQDKYTLAIGLELFSGAYQTEWGPKMAYAVSMTVPMIIFFFFFSKYFAQGLTITGVKG